MNESMERSYDVVARHIMPGQRLHIREASRLFALLPTGDQVIVG